MFEDEDDGIDDEEHEGCIGLCIYVLVEVEEEGKLLVRLYAAAAVTAAAIPILFLSCYHPILVPPDFPPGAQHQNFFLCSQSGPLVCFSQVYLLLFLDL